jgi:energy-coupling factor transporter ATP-binding protein EcfA2
MTNQDDTKNNYVTVKQLLKQIEESKGVLFHDQYNEAFIAVGGTGKKIIKLKSEEFKQWLARSSWLKFKQAPSPNTITKVVQTLIGKAKFDGPLYPLDVRSAFVSDELWYDLCNGSAIKINGEGWEVATPPIAFRRFQHQQHQVLPESGGDLNELLEFVNLHKENDKILFIVYLIAAYIPGFPHPLLILTGPQGAGKSTPMRVMKELIDPSAIKGVSAPGDMNAFAQLAHHHFFLFFDNLSNMPNWLSDALSRISTGDGFSKRALYTDDDDIVYALQKTVALNGINQVVTKADLLDRSLLLTLERIEPKDRIPEEQFWTLFNKRKPKILGSIFDTISASLSKYPSVTIKDFPRMADFAKWGYAIAEASGIGGDNFISAYTANIETQNDEAIEASPIAQAIIMFMSNLGSWQGTAADLLHHLNKLLFTSDLTKSPLWPKDPQWLTKRLNEVQPNLSTRGIQITRYASSEGRITKIENTTVNSVIKAEDIPDFDDDKAVETVNNDQTTLIE